MANLNLNDGKFTAKTVEAEIGNFDNINTKINNLFIGSATEVTISNINQYKYLIIQYIHGSIDATHTLLVKTVKGLDIQTIYSSAITQPDNTFHTWGKVTVNYSSGIISLEGGYSNTIDSSRKIVNIDGVEFS